MNYVIVKLKEDGTKVPLTRGCTLSVAKSTLRRCRNIGITPLAIAENSKKGVIVFN